MLKFVYSLEIKALFPPMSQKAFKFFKFFKFFFFFFFFWDHDGDSNDSDANLHTEPVLS